MKVPFSPPDISGLEIEYVTDVLNSGWITTGPVVKELEKKIAEYTGCARAVALASATASLEGALRILGIGEGDEVIVPAYTYTASASPVHHVGAKIIMADTAPDSFEMDYDKLADLITERTKAVIPVDLGGIVCDYDRIFEVVSSKADLFRPQNGIQNAIGRVIVIADGAHAFGARRAGTHAGAIADFTTFSFHAVKNLTTAEGGALTWKHIEGVDDDELYRQVQLYSLHGQSKDALAKEKAGGWEYDIVYPGYKCNMTNISAALGLAQLERYEGMLARRREVIERYNAAFEPYGIKTMAHFAGDSVSSGHLYLVRIPGATEADRNAVIDDMAAREVACNVHYKPLPMMTAYSNLGFDIKDYPNAYAQYANLITLPLFSRISDEQCEYVIESFIEVLSTRGLIRK
jgi:dTDP-4-amino-4,6-dideoxygalactose transaminase